MLRTRARCARPSQARSGAHYLYRVGYLRTDVGYFVVLGKDAAGWFVVDPYVDHLPQTF